MFKQKENYDFWSSGTLQDLSQSRVLNSSTVFLQCQVFHTAICKLSNLDGSRALVPAWTKFVSLLLSNSPYTKHPYGHTYTFHTLQSYSATIKSWDASKHKDQAGQARSTSGWAAHRCWQQLHRWPRLLTLSRTERNFCKRCSMFQPFDWASRWHLPGSQECVSIAKSFLWSLVRAKDFYRFNVAGLLCTSSKPDPKNPLRRVTGVLVASCKNLRWIKLNLHPFSGLDFLQPFLCLAKIQDCGDGSFILKRVWPIWTMQRLQASALKKGLAASMCLFFIMELWIAKPFVNRKVASSDWRTSSNRLLLAEFIPVQVQTLEL